MLWAIPLGHRVSSDEFGAVTRLRQALHEAVDGPVQGLRLGLGTHLIHPGGGFRPEVAPAMCQEIRVEHPVEVADPRALLTGCLLRSSRKGGWQWGPSHHGRAMVPRQALYACPPLPRVRGSDAPSSSALLSQWPPGDSYPRTHLGVPRA
jgi:hypothetical protein